MNSGLKWKLSAENRPFSMILSASRCLAAAIGVSGARALPAWSRSVLTPPMYLAMVADDWPMARSPRVKVRRRTV